MTNLNTYTSGGLTLKEGILFASGNAPISYPEEGNQNCFQLEDNSFWFKHRNNCIITAVQKYSPDKLFFDIGGGNGFVAKGLQEASIETVLLEPGIQGCQNAKKRGLKNIICATAEEASLKKESIPSIGLFDVVEHIEDDNQFLLNIHQLLAPGGFLYLTVPAYTFLWSHEDDYAGHYKRYTLKTLGKTLINAGFSITYSTYIFSILPLPIFLFRALPYKLGTYSKKNDLSKYKKEHQKENKLTQGLLEKLWKYECKRIAQGKKIPTGGSCFLVAQKTKS